jgi:hypothetical protein
MHLFRFHRVWSMLTGETEFLREIDRDEVNPNVDLVSDTVLNNVEDHALCCRLGSALVI